MKKGIHPEYKKARITCGCGNVVETKNTVGDLTVEICSACHPFFTGKQKLVDTAGRVDKFRAKMETANAIKRSKVKSKKSEPAKDEEITKLDEEMEEIQEELKEETVDTEPEAKSQDENKDSADK